MRRILSCLALLCALAAPAAGQSADPVEAARAAYLAGDHAAAVAALRALAGQGEARALNLLGHAHEHGNGVPQDSAQALAFYRQAAEAGLDLGQYNTGWVLAYGLPGLRPDPAAAIPWLERAAAQGHADAHADLGYILSEGLAGEPDHPRAFVHLEAGAALGSPAAMEWLGDMHHFAIGTDMDLPRAADLYRRAAVQGQGFAAFQLATYYHNGDPLPADPVAAWAFYLLARDAGGAPRAGHGIAALTLAHPELFPDRVEGLANCLLTLALLPADDPDRPAAEADCAALSASLPPAGRQAAAARAEALSR